jgi:hypothetical protein
MEPRDRFSTTRTRTAAVAQPRADVLNTKAELLQIGKSRAGGEMPDMQEGAIRAAGSHDIKLTERREITPYVWVHPR